MTIILYLFTTERPPTPSKPRPSSWIHKTLTCLDSTFGNSYADKFVDAGLAGRDDVLVEPMLEDSDLDTLGVSKLGHRRKILRWFQMLKEGGDDGVVSVKNQVVCQYGAGIVVGHREEDDFYEVNLNWGVLYCLEENAGVEKVEEEVDEEEVVEEEEGEVEEEEEEGEEVEGQEEMKEEGQEEEEEVLVSVVEKVVEETASRKEEDVKRESENAKAMASFGGRKTPSSGKSRGPKNKQQSGSGKKKSGKKKKEVKKDVVAKSPVNLKCEKSFPSL